MDSLLPSAGIAFGSALRATPALGRALTRAGLLDHPSTEHKAHARPAPSLGGAALLDLSPPVGPIWIAAPATVIWLVVCANGFNLTDGIDAMAAPAAGRALAATQSSPS